jgi:1-acyl-sn-glycerol-3-phosphate acyltransferase
MGIDSEPGVTGGQRVFYKFFKSVVFVPVVRGFFRAKLRGAENLPPGGAILAGNHLGAGDTFVMAAMLRRQVRFPGKIELFRGDRGLGSKVVAFFMKSSGQVPLDRSGGTRSMEAFGPVLRLLADGGMVGFYPEGTRSPDGRLYKGKTGVARIALAAGVPVVPVAMFDTKEHRTRIGIPWITRPRVVIGKPLDFLEYADRADDHEVLRWVTDSIMRAIQDLTGQIYVDLYASEAKYSGLTPAEIDAHIQPHPGHGAAKPPTERPE